MVLTNTNKKFTEEDFFLTGQDTTGNFVAHVKQQNKIKITLI